MKIVYYRCGQLEQIGSAFCKETVCFCIRDHSSITSGKRWVGGGGQKIRKIYPRKKLFFACACPFGSGLTMFALDFVVVVFSKKQKKLWSDLVSTYKNLDLFYTFILFFAKS